MLAARETLLLGRGHNNTVVDDRRGAVVVERRYT
jgi:hypothetical protein